MTGVLLIDKPSGPTSHDVVARLRQVTGERRVGHTGTLDPLATGLLALVLGQATRLSSYLTAGVKTYEAVVRLGWATDTDDALGQPVGAVATALPSDAAIDAALAAFRGTYAQLPPTHSAKKVDGHRAYDLARAKKDVTLAPATVTVTELTMTARDADRVHLTVTAGSGFYVRSLARDLGEALGCGGHLASLRRTRSGAFDVADAIPLAEAERLGRDVASRLVTPAEALRELGAVTLTAAGLKRARHGNSLGPQHLEAPWTPRPGSPAGELVRVLAPGGSLVALAHPRGGALHPAIVLG